MEFEALIFLQSTELSPPQSFVVAFAVATSQRAVTYRKIFVCVDCTPFQMFHPRGERAHR